MAAPPKFAILITTKNRRHDLAFTLSRIKSLLERDDVECIICDDGSDDGTFEFISRAFHNIRIFRNEQSKGLIYSRNRLLEQTVAEYAISLDDDLHFITEGPLEIIDRYFNEHPECALISFRIFWSTSDPESTQTTSTAERVKSFAGGAHAWRMSAWKSIPDYPEWFVFHGEEDFAAFQLFSKNMEIHYVPAILTHHRVDISKRKKDPDYGLRLRRSLRSGWYLYLLFLPLREIPYKMIYSIWIQFKTKVFKGDFYALKALSLAIFDVIFALPKIIKNKNRLTVFEYENFMKLADTKLYWKPEGKTKIQEIS